MLLPPPVGASTSASPPATTWRTTSSCWPRNRGNPNTLRNTSAGSSCAAASSSDCSTRLLPADADFHAPALLRGQRELHRAMAALLHQPRVDAVGHQLVHHDLRAQVRHQDVGGLAAGGISESVDVRDVAGMRLHPFGGVRD